MKIMHGASLLGIIYKDFSFICLCVKKRNVVWLVLNACCCPHPPFLSMHRDFFFLEKTYNYTNKKHIKTLCVTKRVKLLMAH